MAKTRPGWPRLGAPAVRWTLWLALVVVCAAGLRDYRVGNDIRAWMPRLASPSPAFVLVGFERDAPSAPAFTSDLARSDRVAGVEPIIGDGALDGLAVFAARGASGSQLLATVRDALAAHDLPAALAGPPVFNEALDTWSQRGLPLASVLILVTGGVALWVTTGRLCAALAGLVAVTTGQIALLGLVAWHRQPMDMMLSMVPPLMMALGFSFAAHRAMRPGVGRVLLLSLATTCIGLGTFVSTDFAPIRSFALWGIVGLVICWAGVVALVPARQVPRVPQPSPATERAPGHRGRAWLAWLGCGAVLLAGGWALPRIGVEHDVLRYFPAESSITADYTALERELTGMLPSQVTITGGAADTHARLAAMIAATPGVRRVIAAGAADGASHHLVLADAGALASLGTARTAWQAEAQRLGGLLRWTGVAPQLLHIYRAVRRTAATSLPVMLGVSGVAGWYVDRRWRVVVASVLINGLPVAALCLVIVITHHPVGLPTLVIGALAIGVAIDDTLHLLAAGGELGSVARAARRCVRPCLGSSLAAAACMATFAVCPFGPTAEFGLLVAAALLIAAAADLLVLPLLSDGPRAPAPAASPDACPVPPVFPVV